MRRKHLDVRDDHGAAAVLSVLFLWTHDCDVWRPLWFNELVPNAVCLNGTTGAAPRTIVEILVLLAMDGLPCSTRPLAHVDHVHHAVNECCASRRNPGGAMSRDGNFDRWEADREFCVGRRTHRACALSNNDPNRVA